MLNRMEESRRVRDFELARLRQRTRATLLSFVWRIGEYDERMRLAMAAPVEHDHHAAAFARQDALEFVKAIVRWVHNEIQWTRDEDTSGVPENWQAPAVTLKTRRGDCEDMALLVLFLCRRAGIHAFRVIVGTWRGEGHAWLETEEGLFADAVPGVVAPRRPSDYEPALMLGGADPLAWAVAA